MPETKLFKQFFTTYASELYGFWRRRGLDKADAEELSQEVFTRILAVDDLTSIQEPRSYVFTVANNLRKERYYTKGRRRHFVHVSLEEALEAGVPEPNVELVPDFQESTPKRLARLQQALLRLAEADRVLLAMRFKEGLSYREIAKRRNVTKTAVEKALGKAIERCGKHMEALKGVEG